MISVKHLSKSFGKVVVLKDVNAEIQKGEVISIIGPSGTGKSTFLRCINRLETPTGGEIWIDGENVLHPKTDIYRLRRKMGMVFQSFNLFSHLLVIENLMLGPVDLLGVSRREAYDDAMRLLGLVGLAEKALAYPDELSGGQKQRVAIARTMAMKPEIILFDEPTSALDPTMVGEVLGVIRRLAKEGLTMMIVTHEMKFARDVSSRVFYMDEGIIYEEGSPRQIFEEPQREKTRSFVKRLKTFAFSIANQTFDFYRLNSELEEFGLRQAFNPRQIYDLQLIFEELAVQQLLPRLPEAALPLELAVGYSEDEDKIELSLLYGGPSLDPFVDPQTDDLSLRIVNHIVKERRHTFDAAGNTLRLLL